ncbi:MAG TPA: hypothetical protein DFS52_13660 [Myxococcales bacterium]|jgi:hypothetical protein|nr:hypothetical protein [Myxococcales bacterium]
MRRTALSTASIAVLAGALAGIGGCSSDPLVLTVDYPKQAIPFDGKSAAQIEVSVMQGGVAINGGLVKFSSSLNGSSFAEIAENTEMPPPDSRKYETELMVGQASATLHSISAGTADVVVNFINEETGLTANKKVSITFGSGSTVNVTAIQFVSAEPSVLQVEGSGGTETSVVTFQVLDDSKAPLKGVEIDFELGSELGGASLKPLSALSGDNGMVVTNLTSGKAYGTVKVRASTKDGSVSGLSGDISVTGSPANYREFTFSCEQLSLGGMNVDNLTVACAALVADRSSQKLGNVQVTFETEAGHIDGVATTGNEIDDQETYGLAVAVHRTGNPRPIDVDPNPAYLPHWIGDSGIEVSQPCPSNPAKTCNPRDGLVTIIAVTQGEEQWEDTNPKNGKWDEGEAFIDLPEPYVDANDNGRYDEGERFVDANNNGYWDDADGKWNSSTLIWRATKLVWTGGVDEAKSGIYDDNTNQKISLLRVPHCTRAPKVKLLIVDDRLNAVTTQYGDSVMCNCVGEGCSVEPAEYTFTGQTAGLKYLGPFSVNDSHSCDPDCRTDEPPCGPKFTEMECSGEFGLSADGEAKEAYSTRIDVDID